MKSNAIRLGLVGSAPLKLDLARLVDTRMLIQANSGGGKSWLLRLLAERAGIQTIVLDPEGEFASLREKLDMLLVGRDGEVPASPRSAALLARRLMEFKVSAVIDLFELKLQERRAFIRQFLDSLMRLPRELWHPALIMLDEAHIYCPERGSGEAESTEAVIALMSQGRKRGYGGIIATQRLSKLHKDAAAETNNVIVGRTWLDADQQRCGDLLGMSKADRTALRDLAPGEFYCFGPAFEGAGVLRFRSDRVATTHPKPGERHLMTPPAPSKAMNAVLAKLVDLPKQADDEIREMAQAHAEIARLKREVAAKPVATNTVVVERMREQLTTARETVRDFQSISTRLAQALTNFWNLPLSETAKEFDKVRALLDDVTHGRIGSGIAQSVESRAVNADVAGSSPAAGATKPKTFFLNEQHELPRNGDGKLGSGQRRILTVLAQYPDGRSKVQAAILTGYAVTGGAFLNYLGALRTAGLIEGSDPLRITDAGKSALGSWEPLPLGPDLRRYWFERLDKAPRLALEALCATYPNTLTKIEVAEAAGYEVTGGGFLNALGKLRTLELISGRPEELKASEALF